MTVQGRSRTKAVAFSGELDLSEAEVGAVRDRVERLESADLYVSGAAHGVDTVAALAALDFFPAARHRVYVPAAWHNDAGVSQLRQRGAEIVQVASGASRAESYMARNDCMVADCALLVAFPYSAREERRSGTWATVRRARKAGRRVLVEPLRPVGSLGQEAASPPRSVVHCQRQPYDVYIGRGNCPRTGERGRWGNPFRIGSDGDREEVIEKYRRWLWKEIQAGRVDLAELAALHGKVLGCWCAPSACHGEVLAEAAMWALTEQARRLAGRVAEMTGRA